MISKRQGQPFLSIRLEFAGVAKVEVVVGRSFATLSFASLLALLSLALTALGVRGDLTLLSRFLRLLPW